MGELTKVEAEVMALQWNALEADRVGLPEDARVFRARAAAYQEQISAIRKKGNRGTVLAGFGEEIPGLERRYSEEDCGFE